MFSDLAVIDIIALAIALLLLGVAAIATYLSFASGSPATLSRESATHPRRHEPAHAPKHAVSSQAPGTLMMSGSVEGSSTGRAAMPESAPAHAWLPDISQEREGDAETKTADSDPPLIVADAPAPPIIVRNGSAGSESPANTSSNVIDLRSRASAAKSESLGERAARLRTRPVSEPEVNRSHVAGPPKELFFANATNKLSVGMGTTEGFAKRKPGFFNDPMGRHELRYWNGSSWTEYVKENGDRFIDPL